MNKLIRYSGGKLLSGKNPITVRRKGVVFLLIDVSDSMNGLVGPRPTDILIDHYVERDNRRVGIVSNENITLHNLKTKLQVAVAGVSAFTEKALANKMVGIALFASSAQLYHPATHDRQSLLNAISRLEYHPLVGGSTDLASGLSLLGLNDSVEAIIVVTDGNPDSKQAALIQGDRLKSSGTEILVIGTEDANWDFIEKFRSRPDLSIKTSNENLGEAILDASRLLKP